MAESTWGAQERRQRHIFDSLPSLPSPAVERQVGCMFFSLGRLLHVASHEERTDEYEAKMKTLFSSVPRVFYLQQQRIQRCCW
eukprot:m.13879 g.13879  ORF g.13879 m.13879 type:complete len:83 (+) comp3329_c0_seq1:3-251(+)